MIFQEFVSQELLRLSKEKIVEEYKDLYHYVSLIYGKLKKNIKNIDIIKAMMPGGSVIGCPKISTLKSFK